ncbi:MAG TPA: hypothetical protein VMH23_09685 [Bacteroidota bacterium]|nr:hypothetical protein [Bacteroidota bacterium]
MRDRYRRSAPAKKVSLQSQLEHARELRRWKLILFLSAIAVIGFLLIAADFFGRELGPIVPIDFMRQDATVTEWSRSGFLVSPADTAGIVVIHEATWDGQSKDKRMGIASLLRAYYSSKPNRTFQKLTVLGDATKDELARITLQTAQ